MLRVVNARKGFRRLKNDQDQYVGEIFKFKRDSGWGLSLDGVLWDTMYTDRPSITGCGFTAGGFKTMKEALAAAHKHEHLIKVLKTNDVK